MPKKTQGHGKGDYMKARRWIGLAMLVGGVYMFLKFESAVSLGAAVLGLLLLVGVKGLNAFVKWGKSAGIDKF